MRRLNTLPIAALIALMTGGFAATASASPADLADYLNKTPEKTEKAQLDLARLFDSTELVTPPAQGKTDKPAAGKKAKSNSKDNASKTRVGLSQALRGERPDVRCIKVRKIRPWKRAKRKLLRQRYKKTHVIRFVPRRVSPIAGKAGQAICTGGWYLVRAKKGRITWRLAVDARTGKVAARTRH